MSHTTRRVLAAATAATLLAGVTQLPVFAATAPTPTPATLKAPPRLALDSATGLPDLDVRGRLAPSAAQQKAAKSLGGLVRWNAFGTPSSIAPINGSLGKATSSDAPTAAKSWLRSHAALFAMGSAQLGRLVLVNNQKLAGSSGRAVLFRQDFGGPAPAIDSMVTVGIGNGAVQYVSSSLARTRATSVPAATLKPSQAWQKAAASVGIDVATDEIGELTTTLGWTRFKVTGLAQQQQVRLRSLVSARGTVRPVFETNVVDVKGGAATAYTMMVDAVTGRILVRQNKVDQATDAPASQGSTPIQGSVTATDCGPKHPFTLTDDNTRTILATAAEAVTTNDIVVKIFSPSGALLTTGDNGTSPEFATYSAASIPKGTYSAQVCPFKSPTAPFVPPGTYTGAVVTSDQGAPSTGSAVPYPPKWDYFLANPTLDYSVSHTPKNRVTGCWVKYYQGKKVPGCTTPPDQLSNIAARGPWDVDPRTTLPTFTTIGNAANTHEAWANPLAPGGTAQAPYSPTREYTDKFTDAWNNSKCDPTQLRPGGNDINAAVTNLFVAHNRMHDWSYILGFTERNYNLQTSNFGENPDPSRQNDPEIGNVQAGAISGGAPSYLGRDNANQIALQDGIPGITNQYLFQPIAGAFYSPCVDGSTDMTVTGHEYTHAISNRMIGGPDEGITSQQGGAMGESWSDLDALEYLFENQYSTGANPWVEGPYATGNTKVGIRDYALNHNPLNYSDYGFDTPGPEVHADGEIWNGTMFEVRQAMVDKWNKKFPYSDKHLQHECARIALHNGPRRPIDCPGNRRWIQLMFDSFLLQQGATSMLDARDAFLGADRMRFHGANQSVIWNAFARRGMGNNASTKSADDNQPKPGFGSPRTKNATVTFKGRSSDGSAAPKGKVYVGDYEARVTPVADTDPKTALPSSAKFAPGTYRLTYVAPGNGMSRWSITVKPGQKLTKTFGVTQNLASAKNGAKVIGASAGSLNAASLIDDTESTNWAGVNQSASVDATHPFVTVDLAGSKARTIRSVRVSALLRPAAPTATSGLPVLATDDPGSGSRFTALRKFALEVCTTRCTSSSATWKRIYTSPSAAFPGARPRPLAPNLTLRSFNVKDTKASAVRLVALENQCTGTPVYAGEQDNDPLNSTDCKASSDADLSVRAAELEVF